MCAVSSLTDDTLSFNIYSVLSDIDDENDIQNDGLNITLSSEVCTPSLVNVNDSHAKKHSRHDMKNSFSALARTLTKNDGFSIGCLNVRGLLSKYEQIVLLLNECHFDFFGLCETFLDSNVPQYEYKVEGYNSISRHRNRHGGGVLLYVNELMKFEYIYVPESQVESVWISTRLKGDNVAIGIMYRPPSADNDYFSAMLNQLDFIHDKFDKVILMGDLNFNYDFDVSLRNNPIHNIESLYEMEQLVTNPTRVTTTSSTLLDVILSNVSQYHVLTRVHELSVSDHYLVYTILKFKKPFLNHREVKFRNFKDFNAGAFMNDLRSSTSIANTNWSGSSLESKWFEFKECFFAVCNKHAPVQTRRLKNRNNPWITPEIVKLMYERDYLKKKAVKLKCSDLWDKYVVTRNKVTKLIRESKLEYASIAVSQNKNDSKKMWKALNRLTGRDHRKSSCCNIDAHEYNDFFNLIGKKTVSHLQHTSENEIYWNCSKSIYTFDFVHITEESVRKYLLNLGDVTTVDVLGFDGKLLFYASSIISPIISKFFNLSMELKVVLQDWKLSRVTPVYKGKGSRDEYCNYRPISVICHIAKILERLIQVQVMNYLSDHELITIDQSAYLKYHSTQTSLHRVVNDWSWNIEDGDITGVCALDISKCFDTINHKILLEKLKFYGFAENVVSWFSSYLHHRGHMVACNNKCSDVNFVEIGVPQGSVLGPTLFLIYVNDINNNLGSTTCNIYADDVLIYCSGKEIGDVNVKLQHSLDVIKQWYDNNLLVVNSSKSNAMMVTTRQRELLLRNSDYNGSHIDLVLNDDHLDYVEHCKYLGVDIDKNLNWNVHVEELSKQLNSMVWMLARLRKFLPLHSLTEIYKSIVQPKIDYAITLWGYSTDANINKIQRMQNRAIRAILNNFDYVNCRGIELVKTLNLFNVKQRRDYFMALFMFRSIHGLVPNYISNEITMSMDVIERVSRIFNRNDLYVPTIVKKCARNTFAYTGPKLWNSLSNELKECTNIDAFKVEARKYFLQC